MINTLLALLVSVFVFLAMYQAARMALVASRSRAPRTVGEKAAASDAEAVEALLSHRERILTELRDLRFDYEMKKLSEDDYRSLSAAREAEALDVMAKLSALGGKRRGQA